MYYKQIKSWQRPNINQYVASAVEHLTNRREWGQATQNYKMDGGRAVSYTASVARNIKNITVNRSNEPLCCYLMVSWPASMWILCKPVLLPPLAVVCRLTGKLRDVILCFLQAVPKWWCRAHTTTTTTRGDVGHWPPTYFMTLTWAAIIKTRNNVITKALHVVYRHRWIKQRHLHLNYYHNRLASVHHHRQV